MRKKDTHLNCKCYAHSVGHTGCYIGASNSYQPLVRYLVSLKFLLAATLLCTHRQDRSQSMTLFNMLSTLNVWPRSLYLKMRFTMGKTSLNLEFSLSHHNLLHYIASYCFKVMNLTNIRNVSSLEPFIYFCAAKAAVNLSLIRKVLDLNINQKADCMTEAFCSFPAFIQSNDGKVLQVLHPRCVLCK
jgi:hypothetical protein